MIDSIVRCLMSDGTTWAPLGAGVGGSGSLGVLALVVFDDGSGPALYAGGTFTTAGGQPAARSARWDGSVWSALGSGVGSISSDYVADIAVFDDGTGPALYVAGRFTVAGGGEALHMARWDGATWSAVGGGMNGAVRALTVYDAGSGSALYAGGSFTSAGGIAANRVARWDGTAWEPLGNGITGIVGSVDVLLGHNDGSGWALYAGGSFTSGAARQIARWNGSTWGPVGGGIGMPTGWVYTLCRFDEGLGTGAALFAGGDFNLDGAVDMHDLLVLLSIWGSVDPPFGDLDGNGTVGSGDLLILLANWGPYMP